MTGDDTQSVVKIYSLALFHTTERLESTIQVVDEIETLHTIFLSQKALLTFLEAPHIKRKDKHTMIEKALGGKCSPTLFNLLRVLIDKGRITLVSSIFSHYLTLVEEHQGLFEATLHTAFPLSQEDIGKLQKKLEEFTEKQLRLDVIEKPDLIGGVVFRFKDVLVDGSIRGGLEQLEKTLRSLSFPIEA